MSDEKVCISKGQRNFHIATEALSVLIMVPFLSHVSETHPDPKIRRIARAGMIGSLLIDGGLLVKWATRRKEA